MLPPPLPAPMPLKILVVDDHPMMSAALADVLRGLAPKVETLIAHSGAAALQLVTQHADLDLAWLDLGLPDTDGFDLLARVRALPRCAAGSGVRQRARAGYAPRALGFIPKSTPPGKLLPAIRQVLAGEALSARQLDVLRLICVGKSNKFIAQELALSEKTVKGHVTAIFKSLDVVNRTQAALNAQARGLCDARH